MPMPAGEIRGHRRFRAGGDAMKALSFWGLCRVTTLNYVDRIARNLRRHAAAANAEIIALAKGAGSRRSKFAGAISARRTAWFRVEVKAPVREPLAGVAVHVDD